MAVHESDRTYHSATRIEIGEVSDCRTWQYVVIHIMDDAGNSQRITVISDPGDKLAITGAGQ
jgi:hypothetical protein